MMNVCTKNESNMSENRYPQASTDTSRLRERDAEGGDNNGMYVGDIYVYTILIFKCYRSMLLF